MSLRHIIAFLLSTILLAATQQARAQEIVEAVPLAPKIVLQTLPFGGVEVAGWTLDDRYIITAAATSRTALIWNAETGHIVDKLMLPSEAEDGRYSHPRFMELKVTADGKKAIIMGEAFEPSFETGQFLKRALEYRIDMKSRAVEMIVGEATASTQEEFRAQSAISMALAEYFDHRAGVAEEPKLAPALPPSHDAKRQLVRTPQGMAIISSGADPKPLEAAKSLRIKDAALSPDFRQFAMVRAKTPNDPVSDDTMSLLDIFTVETGQFGTPVPLDNDYSKVQWLGGSLLVATQLSDVRGRQADFGRAVGLPPRMAFVDVDAGGKLLDSDARCFTVVSPDSHIFGAGLANCRFNAGESRDVQRFDLDENIWRPFGDFRLPRGTFIDAMAVSDESGTLGMATIRKDGTIELIALDSESGKLIARRTLEGTALVSSIVLPTDDMMVITVDNRTVTWILDDNSLVEMPLRSFATRVVDSDGQVLAVAGLQDAVIGRMDLNSFQTTAPVDYGKVIAGGFLPDRPIFWALSAIEGLRFWNTSEPQWREILTTYFFEGQGFVTVNPQGRYDSNLGPDIGAFRWLVEDRPYQSLPQQTFMRDFYLPGLTEKLIDCSSYDDCELMLEPLPDVKQLTRATPDVKIVDVVEGENPAQALVKIEIKEGFDKDAPAERQKSGVYSLRLFINNRLVDQDPMPLFTALPELQIMEDIEFLEEEILALDPEDPESQSIQDDLFEEYRQAQAKKSTIWQEQNLLSDMDDKPGDGIYNFTFQVDLPTLAGTEDILISAYAFNKDRIKSETYTVTYQRNPVAPVKPRAFVISIGVDTYEKTSLNLNYAGADAKLFNNRLTDIPGYEMRRLMIAGEAGSNTKVTSSAIFGILSLLGGLGREQYLEELQALGIDASMLEESRPDDIIIISYSGHGWASTSGNFYLVPYDAAWYSTTGKPIASSLVSSYELTGWLSFIKAAEIVLVIDACHSGASVDSGRFKPGPMGDGGLGQLAYDKGIRILVATQAGDVAYENDKLKHGLLSYALAGKGQALDNPDGLVDIDGDRKMMLDEWLRYPTWSLLSADGEAEEAKGETAEEGDVQGAFYFPYREPRKEEKVQLPSLFDFAAPSTVVLKEIAE